MLCAGWIDGSALAHDMNLLRRVEGLKGFVFVDASSLHLEARVFTLKTGPC